MCVSLTRVHNTNCIGQNWIDKKLFESLIDPALPKGGKEGWEVSGFLPCKILCDFCSGLKLYTHSTQKSLLCDNAWYFFFAVFIWTKYVVTWGNHLTFFLHLLCTRHIEITTTNRKTAPVAAEIHTTLETPDEVELSSKKGIVISVSQS